MAHFEGQVDRLVFTLEHVRALASPSASSVFWTLSAHEPMSARDLSQEIGRSASSIHYHLDRLLECGLALEVAVRKKRSRQERLFVRAGVFCIDQGIVDDPEYNECRVKAFAATMRVLCRENELLYQIAPHYPEAIEFSHYRRAIKRLTLEQARDLRAKMHALLGEVLAADQEPDGTRVQVFFVMRPTQGESMRWFRELGLALPPETPNED